MREQPQSDNDLNAQPPSTDSVSTSSVVEDPKAAEASFKHHSDQFASGAAKTNTILLAWSASLIVMLIAYIIPLSVKVAKLSKLDEYISKGKDFISGTNGSASQQKTPLTGRKQKGEDARSVVNDKLVDSKSQKARLQGELSVIHTPLGDVPIPPNYLPLVWVSLFTGLFSFFVYKRVVLLATLAQIIDIHIRQRGKPIEEVRGLGSWAPLWLAPLPKVTSDPPISAVEFSQFLGWEPGGKRRLWLCCSFLGVSFVVYAWVLLVLIRVSHNFGDPQDGRRLRFVGLVTAAVCILTWVWGFWPTVNPRTIPERLIEHSSGRRRFLTVGGSVAALALGYAMLPRRALPRWLTARNSRWKKQPKNELDPYPQSLRNTFQLNWNSGAIHYIDSAGLTGERSLPYKYLTVLGLEEVLAVLLNPNPAMLGQLKARSNASIKPSPEPAPMVGHRHKDHDERRLHFPARQEGSLIECLAIELADKGEIPRSLQLLWIGIERDAERAKKSVRRAGERKRRTHPESGYRTSQKPSYRLYDLFARLAAQSSNTAELSRLSDFVRTSFADDYCLADRTRKWLDPSSHWSKKITGNKVVWKGPKKAPGKYAGYC